DWNIRSEVVGRLKIVLTQLKADQDKINGEIEKIRDLTWRRNVFGAPSGIVQLIKALVFPRDSNQLEIWDNTSQDWVSTNVIYN
ncbi:hypothetical protein PIB30_111657, partial [Stylosanthes scabra]|nr:hypothetical protein [Stylosanthes scabra]